MNGYRLDLAKKTLTITKALENTINRALDDIFKGWK